LYRSPPSIEPKPRQVVGRAPLWIAGSALLSLLLIITTALLLRTRALLPVLLFNPNPWIAMIYWLRRRGDAPGWGCLACVIVEILTLPAMYVGLLMMWVMMHPPH
jgi:hypothetical protein